jgi:tyrosyl-tRNA synthetase
VELYKNYGCTLQISGSDQWGNIISGIELGRRMKGLELYGLTAPLITKSDGSKMGKSVSGAVWLSADRLSPYDYYQFWRNAADADVGKMLATFTEIPMDEVRRLAALQGAEINEAKKILAHAATAMCHGAAAADAAAATAQQVFEQGTAGGDLPVVAAAVGAALVDVMVQAGLAESKSEARRLIKGKGVRLNDAVVEDEAARVGAVGEYKLSVGKKKHAVIVVG